MRAKYFFLFLMVALLGCHSEQKLKNNQSIKLKQQYQNFFPIMKFQKLKKIIEIMHHVLLDDTKGVNQFHCIKTM